MSEPQYLKMEDLHTTASASPAPTPASESGTYSQSSPAPIVVTSKPAKKRKSWGQELPEPKTALPPRKRAKTDDEKEQRRIERIKRNRAAAHNSRERKRQETEDLAVKLARANAELRAFRSHFGDLPSHIVLPEVKVEIDDSGCISTTTHSVSTPAPSLVESHGSQADPSSPIPPADDTTLRQIKMEPNETSPDFAYPALEDSKSSGFMPLDLTQHSAAMLCYDLPCRSSRMNTTTDMLQDAFSSYVDSFAFADGAYDASISGPLFSMEEFINVNEDSHFANDAQTSGAV
ncbi:Putative basic-leucine zipper domain, transcriptional activator Hac1/HY5 [Septoria linicola]|uniref:Basic-leucine zipper domain, transcriptional activator Hac1/HY5 n=1 Tax=Septoria linicola TaxID=215465 RepID=A0A9Q9B322_9PEZI|nr:putative basic-leucine zipper domain, transcriptional activator Hac1/HY5 [Septoria linicola]USW55436.1 Putative basic-leucine zipper domain, transcriptional activator Hac1/HY5 [Septoria linicola]